MSVPSRGERESRRALGNRRDLARATWIPVTVRPERTVHRVRAAGTDLAVTWIAPEREDRRRRIERVRIERVAGNAGLGPPVVVADPDRGVTVTVWFPAPAWSERDLCDPDRLAQLAGLLARLHRTPVEAEPLDLIGAIDRYRARLGTDSPDIAELLGLAESLGPAPRGAGLVHGDVTAANVVGSPPRLVDWEYAAPGDPLFDLASVLALHAVPPAGRRTFLDAYVRRGGDPPDPDRLPRWERLVVLLARVWAASVLALAPDDPRAAAWLRGRREGI